MYATRTNAIRNGQRFAYGLAAAGALALTALGFLPPSPAHATPVPAPVPAPAPAPAPQTVSYAVTDDNGTALELGIDYRENLDYEADATTRLNPAGTDTICERFAAYSPTDGYLLTWYECADVPVNERPRTPEYS